MAGCVKLVYLLFVAVNHVHSTVQILSSPGIQRAAVDDDVTFIWRTSGFDVFDGRIVIKTEGNGAAEIIEWNDQDVWVKDAQYKDIRDQTSVGFSMSGVRTSDADTVYKLVIYQGSGDPLINKDALLAVQRSPADPVISLDPDTPDALLEGHPLTLKCDSNTRTIPKSAALPLEYTWERINKVGTAVPAGLPLEHVYGSTLLIYNMSQLTTLYKCTARESHSRLSVSKGISLNIKPIYQQTEPAKDPTTTVSTTTTSTTTTATTTSITTTVDEAEGRTDQRADIISPQPQQEDPASDYPETVIMEFVRYGLGPLIGFIIILVIGAICWKIRRAKRERKMPHPMGGEDNHGDQTRVKLPESTNNLARGATNPYGFVEIYADLDDKLIDANHCIAKNSGPPLPPNRNTMTSLSPSLSGTESSADTGYLSPQTSGNSVKSIRPCLVPPPSESRVTVSAQLVPPSGGLNVITENSPCVGSKPQQWGASQSPGGALLSPGGAQQSPGGAPRASGPLVVVTPTGDNMKESPETVYDEPNNPDKHDSNDDDTLIYGNKTTLASEGFPSLFANIGMSMHNRRPGGSTCSTLPTDAAMCQHPLLEKQSPPVRQNSYLIDHMDKPSSNIQLMGS